MTKPKKINNRLIKSLLIFGALIVVVIMIAPQLINLEMVRENIENTLSKEIGGEIKYRRLDLSYFPRPHVVVHKVEILIPDSFTIKMHRMKVYPKILPLFLGSLQVGVVTLEYADYFMKLPQISREAPQPEQLASFDAILEAISKAIRGLPEFKLPELKMRVRYGKINLVDPFGRKFKLREVQAAYQRQPNELDFSIRCKSNLWDQIDVNGSLNPSNFKGKGHIRLSRFRPQALMAYLLHDAALRVTDTNANLTIDVELDGTGNLEAVVDGAVPLLALSRGEEQLIIKGGRIQGRVQIGGKTVAISLTEMGLDYPKLEATGMFSYDENLKDIQLAINGSRIDAASVRQVALGLLGESETIQNIFEIIRGGYVPWMTVRIRGHRIAELGMLDNIVIKGRMTQGKIFIPGVELNLDDVIGDAHISEGILHGENLEAQMGNSGGRDGKMTLGLNEDLAPFQLKIGVDADLSQLPPVLGRVVRDKDFLNELALIKDVKGTATGMLTLGDDLASLNAEVEASNIHLTARYKRIPSAVEIDGGHFYYGGTRLAFDNFNANIGKSSFLNPSIAVDWTGTPGLNIRSQSAKINLDELYIWLLSFDALKKNLNNIKELKGEVAVNNLEIKGPFFSPQDWRFQTRGVVNKLVLTSEKLPKSLRIGRGRFTWQGTKITFKDVNAAMGKSSIGGVAGDVNWAKVPVFSARSGRTFVHLEDVIPLIFSYKNISTNLDRFKPISGSLVFKRMTISGPVLEPSFGQVSFSADVEQLMLQSKGLPGPLRVDEGNFSWRKNRFALKEIDASLGNSTISRLSAGFDLGKSPTFEAHSQSVKLIADEVYPWLLSFKNIEPFLKDFSVTKGMVFLPDLNFNGPLHLPAQWHYALTCNMKNLVLTSDAFGDPVTVNNGSFDLTSETTPEAARNRVRMNATDLTWGENHLTLIGGMILSKNKTLLDLTLTAETIDWNQVNKIVDYAEKKRKNPDSRLRKRDLLGTLKFQADNFTYETYSVNPLKADLSFKPDKVVITVNEAVVCSISFQGRLKVNEQTLEIFLVPTAVNQMLAPAVSCITDQERLAMGTFNLNGQLRSKSKPDEFLRSLSGEVAFSAEQGRIYRFGLLAKILSILNVTEIYRGEIPDLTGEGFAYHGMTISADLEGGKLIMQECAIDGVSMGIACEGNIDFAEKKMDLIVLVAPFKTVDRIVKFLPLIGHILGGKLISIPFRAKGDLTDPDVIPLSPTAVGSGVLGILERTLKLPITIMQPVFSLGKSKKNKKNDQNPDENPEPSGSP
jgi:hypothetical protein